ncbi:2OG-Fe(II) oxygenase [Streptomyces sp. NPDC098781]|uniref:2OG-Fe(II) oxygenase n=1 Tax=Streptomyces sp. NPDC098781 TaxID=3366097 RepID=UPI0037F67908
MLVRQDALSSEALGKLVDGEALAVQVPAYHSPELCEEIAGRVLARLGSGYQRIYESNVRAFTETNGDVDARREYLAESASLMSDVRESCHPLASPIDKLRCELDELWPGGARLLRHEARALVFGMVRVWRNGAEARPHLDVLRESAPDVLEAQKFTDQIGVNIYLRVPEGAGDGEGALELWDLGLADSELIGDGLWGTYGYRREALPSPEVVVRPQVGDLVMLRTTRMHAVRPTCSGERVTFSGFIGHSSGSDPLLLWS